MTTVRLREPLKRLAGGRAEHALEGATVAELLARARARAAGAGGWILDERGELRRHINVYVGGERGEADTPVGADDRVDVLPAISGGAAMTELLVGTKKGLFVLEGEPGGGFEVTARAFAGEPVEYAMRDPRIGPHARRGDVAVLRAEALVRRRRRRASGSRRRASRCPRAATQALERIWVIVPGEADGRAVRGRRPGRAVRERRRRRELVAHRALWDHPTRPGLAAGRRRAVPALDRAVAGRAGPARARDVGRRRVADRRRRQTGATATRASSPRYVPEDAEPGIDAVRPRPRTARPRRPERMFMQFHGGVYRSDDAGESWTDDRRRAAVGLRLPDGARPRRPRLRLRDPARRPTSTASRPAAGCASTRRATPARRGRRAATGCRASTPT